MPPLGSCGGLNLLFVSVPKNSEAEQNDVRKGHEVENSIVKSLSNSTSPLLTALGYCFAHAALCPRNLSMEEENYEDA